MDTAKLKELRQRTNVPLGLCKNALEKSNWDVEGAIVVLQKMGELKKAERASKSTNAGRVYTYLHHNGQIAVVVEVNCETEFSANAAEFKEFCELLALQVASTDPKYLSVNEISANDLDRQREIFTAQVPKNTPDDRREHIINGKMKKWFTDCCLVEQKSVVVDKMTIEQLRESLVQKICENVLIKRFVRWEVGEAI